MPGCPVPGQHHDHRDATRLDNHGVDRQIHIANQQQAAISNDNLPDTPTLVFDKESAVPKDIYEVIDTAIKIGLGAAIGGISSYLLSMRTFKQDQIKSDINDRRTMLKTIADKFEKSNKETDTIATRLSVFVISEEKKFFLQIKKDCTENSIQSIAHIQSAKSLSNLLGLNDLFLCLDNYKDSLVNFNFMLTGLKQDSIDSAIPGQILST